MKKLRTLVMAGEPGYADDLFGAAGLLEPEDPGGEAGAVAGLPMVDPESFVQGLPSRDVAQLRQKESLARRHWASHFPIIQGETVQEDGIRFLTQGFRGHGAGGLVYFRRSDRGYYVVFLDHLQFDAATREVALDVDALGIAAAPKPAFGTGLHAMAIDDVSAAKWAGEVSMVVSLVGMTMNSTMPEVGIPLMLAGQIFSFVFGHLDGGEKKPLPSIEEIRTTIKSLLAQAHVADLSEEAYSVWDDYLTYYDKSWENGYVANEETLELFKSVILRATSLEKVGGLHDNVNKIHDNCLKKDGVNPVGLQWIPAFVYAATVELTFLEAAHNLEMYSSRAGRSKDEGKNKDYRLALEAWNTRAHDLAGKMEALLSLARRQLAQRLAAVGGPRMIDDVIPDPSGNRMKFSITEHHHWEFDDAGTWPSPPGSNPSGRTEFAYTTNCCGTSVWGDENGSEIAKQRESYLVSIAEKVRPALGISQEDAVSGALAKWQQAAGIAAANREMLAGKTG